MTETYAKKAFNTKIIYEEEKLLSCTTHIKYSLKNKSISVACSFSHGRNHIKIELNRGIHHNSLLLDMKRDSEIKEKVKELIIKNPLISSNEIKEKTGYCGNKLNQIYMTVKREIHRKKNRETVQ